MDKRVPSVVFVVVLVASCTHGAEVYVNPTTGDDAADGLSPTVQGKSGRRITSLHPKNVLKGNLTAIIIPNSLRNARASLRIRPSA
ncbi:hypothetical protein ACFL5Q_00380 [Planctomycetota bacterium]